ncbi:DUF1697 domain-containing protein [Devosia sp.]|uniref:DUF1697 domain-containing protein n=1 Tax=Devosia sp. TaxID=1871048 RepID=UPI003A8F5F56
MTTYIALLRAIGPATHKVMSMHKWWEAASRVFDEPETYIATGNMIFESSMGRAEVTRRMNAIVSELGLGTSNRAVIRTLRQLKTVLRSDPFSDATAERPGDVSVHFFAKGRPKLDWITSYDGPERIAAVGPQLIVDYGTGGESSRLRPLIEKRSGEATARNWNTLRGLIERAQLHES